MDCCFDSAAFTGVPDTAPCPTVLNVPELIGTLDGLYAAGRETEAGARLEGWLHDARIGGDWRSELTVLSELLGQYRRSGEQEKGLAAVDAALELIRAHGMGSTVSGATVMLNAATTLKCFSRAAQSLPIFAHVCRVFAAKLDPGDYRFAGLYNNMALSCADTGDIDGAERYFELAMQVISACEHPENDMAVTLCNMAEMYGRRDSEDRRVEQCLESAWGKLNAPTLPRDGYHAFTVSKCAPCFDYFGFFIYAKELRERAENIYVGT